MVIYIYKDMTGNLLKKNNIIFYGIFAIIIALAKVIQSKIKS